MKEYAMVNNTTLPTEGVGLEPVADTPAVHNSSVDEDAASAGACAQVHLPTGAMCALVRGHEGSCEFVPRQEAEATVARYRAAKDC
jgi:hypothetical protein